MYPYRKKNVSIRYSLNLQPIGLDLARMIGFKAGTIYLGKDVPITGEKPLDLASNMNSFYVYCDLLQPILVRDTKVPLLRIVDKSEKGRYG